MLTNYRPEKITSQHTLTFVLFKQTHFTGYMEPNNTEYALIK